MKKILISSIAILSLVACSKTDSPVKEQKSITLGASIEQPTDATASTAANISAPDVKATLNNSLSTLWATGDIIRMYVANDPNDWHDEINLTLASGAGSTNGVFRAAAEYGGNDRWNNYAFFPYYYTSSTGGDNTGSNMGGGGFYFHLPESYYNYTSGQSFLPLLANMSGGSTQPASVSFKHVGGAVVVNLTGVPGAAKSLGMTIAGKNIQGWPGKVVLSEVGTDSGKITASNGDNSTVWMNFATAAGNRDFKFIFPVPSISSTSNITFTMYDKNDVMIWQKTASSQPAIGRAQALVMPNKAVSPVPHDIYLAGYINGSDVYTTDNNTYKFVNGSLSLNLTQDSYVLLNFNNTNKEGSSSLGNQRYLLPAYEGSATSATFSVDETNYDHKLKVPAGNKTFTLAYNTDGTITLSYK